MHRFALALLGAWAFAACATEVDADLLIANLRDAPRTDASRLARLRELFSAAGCANVLTEQAVPGSGLPNLLCSAPGTTGATIVVGAHFDKVSKGRGVADNWSGALLLPELYRTLPATRIHSFTFVAFAGEERGELGSRAFVKQLAANHRVVAMINLDTLGLGPAGFEPRESDPELARILRAAAVSTGIELVERDNGRADHSDHEPFLAADIAAIRLHSLTPRGERIVHGRADRFEAIDPAAYADTAKLVAAFLATLDE
jgi:Zn-dependent M28 family amino/carboxypeptidase